MSQNPMNVIVSKLWKDDIDEAIIKVCWRIIQEPLLYFSEADIQQMLVEALHEIKSLKKLYDTSVLRGEGAIGKYQTSLVHREYGAGGGQRFDVVILNPTDVKKIDDVNLTKNGAYLSPAYVFELGTEKTGDIRNHFEKDIKKLKAGTEKGGCGYLIHLYKDSTLQPRGSRTGQETDDKIDEDFKKVFEGEVNRLPSNIKVLAILLRTGKKGEWIKGKCEIFDGAKGEWPQKNIRKKADICDALRKQLK
jgi:hypothetical protein